MKRILSTLTLLLCFAITAVNAQGAYDQATMGEKVYLETANWGQNSPFNKQIFTSYGGSTNAKAGCVPTAYAIVMRYHEFPTEGTSKTLYNCQASTYVEITDRVYDFSKMPLTNGSGWTEEQQTEVAKFFSHVLHACFPSSIGTGATTVNEGQTSKVLNDYFNYQLINASYQANFTMEQWAEKLRESIDKGCPVPYAANNSGTGDTRHMFVVDGYTTNGYFHFNFGWSGSGNGWFKLDNITPSQGDNYSWNGNSQHYALFNLAPNKTPRTVTATANPSSMGTVSINGGTAGNSVSAEVTEGTKATLAAHPVDGYALANWTKNGVVVGTKNPIQVSVGESGNDYVANFDDAANVQVEKTCTFKISDVTTSGVNGGYCSTWTTSDGIVLNCTKGSEPAYALSTTVNTFFAKANVGNSETLVSDITYTLTAPAGYIIKSYSFKGNSPSSSYTIDVTVGGNTTNVTNASAGVVISASDINAQSTSFILGSTYAGRAGLAILENGVTVTIQSEGGGSTPTPDPTPTTYTVTTTASPVAGGTAKFAVGTGSQKTQGDVENGTEITLYAVANTGYNFVNWTLNGAEVSNSATCNVSVSQAANYVANFEAEANAPVEVSGDLEFTFTRNGENATVTVSGADGVTATITATSPNTTNTTTKTGVWNTGSTMANSTNILCTSTNTTNASESSPITYTLIVNGLKANITAAKFTNIAVNNAGGLQQVNNSTRQCNFKLDANGETVKTLSNQNIWVTSGTDNTIAFNDLNIDANGTLTIKLTIYKGTDNVGCYYGLKKITLTAAEPEQPGDPLAGKYFRLKVKNTTNYMNIGNTSDNTGATSGVTVVAKNESSDTQVFLFEQSGDGYKLKANSGNYIKCHAWNANANTTSANDATVLTFEPTGNELEYFIKWDNTNMNNGVERDDYFKAENGYIYCDAASNAASTWVLEEVIPSNEKTLNVTFAGATWNNEASGWWVSVVTNTTPAVTVRTTDGTPKIGFSTFNSVRHPYLLDGNSFTISLPANCKITGYRLGYQAHNLVSKSVTYTNGKESTGTVNITQSNEQNTLTVTGLDNNEISFSVEDQSSQAGFIIKSLEITYIENEFEPAMFKAEIENWRNDNPNTHLGTITIGGTPLKLTPEHLTASELTMPLAEGTTLAFTRKYRGFEFQGFYIGETSLGTNPTLTAANVAAIDENNPLIAKFTTTDDVTLFYDDDTYSYRIPAIAKTGTNRLVAISDYRHNLDDIGRDNHGTGKKRIDLVMRTSDDNGATWSDIKTIAAGDDNQVGSYLRAFGDAAVAAVGNNIIVMAAAGDVLYTNGTTSSPNRMARIYSTDNGVNWAKEEMTTKMYSTATSLIPNGGSAFFGSGKLAVDPNFNGTGNARVYGALLVRIGTNGYNNFGVFSDDLGATWKILGGSTSPVASGDEPKVEILPNGQILLSARRGGGRVFRVFTYGDDKANGAGSWGDAAVNGCDNGGSNATNGEIICLDAKKPNGNPTKILLQSQPKGGSGQYDRYNVTIWYKEVSADETYTPSSIASGWTQGLEVSPADVKSAYSAMCLQENGEIAFFFEEAPCYGDDHTKGYSMVYVPLTIEEITNNNFLNPNADVEYVPVEFNIELTDAEGNIYCETLDYVPTDVAAALTSKYPFITLGANGELTGSDNAYTYTNTVTLPFKVSNAETTAWYNIYWPANGTSNGEYYPIYLSSTAQNNSYVVKTTEKVHYGNSQYNTLAYADKLSWAVYNVNNSFTFKFKNKLTGKFMAVNGVVSSGNADNVIYTEEANATAFTLEKYTGGNASYGNYAIKSIYNGTTGYVCNTSVGHANATNYTGTGHAGAWAKFVEAPDYQAIVDALIADINNFGEGEGKYVANDAISKINKDALATMPINSLNTQKETVQTVKNNYSEITLTIPVANSGSVKIKEEDVSNKFVQKGEVTIEAVPAAGYYFVNWTKPAAQATAAARNVEARNAVEVVSTDNPYTFNLTDAVSLEANFDLVVVTATLTDGQGNQYIVELDGFTNGITKETVAAKLVEKYPYITLGTAATGITLEGGDAAYTYTNTVTLPFKVSNTTDIWHDIYWPANGTSSESEYYPIYLMANAEDATLVAKVTETKHYGNSQYNTYNNTEKLAWAVYNVDNAFAFKFKNKLTGKFISVNGVVSSGNANNVIYTDEANATAFTLTINPRTNSKCKGDFALTSVYNGTTGYVCNTSAGHPNATNCTNNNHPGAWVKIVETPDYYSKIMDLRIVLGYFFGAGDGKCVIAGTEIEEINTAIQNNSGSITLNNLTEYAATMENAMNNNADWHDVALTVAPEETGTAIIQLANDDPALTRKRVPTKYNLTINATPAEGYSFVNWTKDAEVVSTDAKCTYTVEGATTLTANFAKNTYTISVLAGEGGSASASAATVEHGNEVTLTAVADDGYRFVNWTKGTDVVSADANYTFAATADGEYVANFELANTPVTYYTVNIVTEGISNDKFAAYINTGTTQNEIQKSYKEGSTVSLTAVPDNVDVGSENYLFTGWYIGNELISPKKDFDFTLNGNVTYTAKFEKGCRVAYSCRYIFGYINVLDAGGNDIGGTGSVLLKNGTTIQMKATPNNNQYQFTNWTDGIGGNEVSTDNPYVVEVNNDMQLYANFEPRHYVLTVRANDDSFGTVTAESGTFGPASEVKVGVGMTATITATPASGYRFVNWTKGTDVVSTNVTYEVPAIDDVNAMANTEYVANFVEADALDAGYYRIAYDFPVAAAKASATRAATSEYVSISATTGTLTDGNSSSEWISTDGSLIFTAKNAGGSVKHICKISTGALSLNSYNQNGAYYTTEYTVAVPEGSEYKIVGYSLNYKAYKKVNVKCDINNYDVTLTDGKSGSMEATSLNVNSFTFAVSRIQGDNSSSASAAIDIESFIVYLEKEITEIPTERYYVQSGAVNATNNAMPMTTDGEGVASIFYYDGGKLLSYQKGTYVKEEGTTCGLQDVGAYGDAMIKVVGTNDEDENICTVAAPYFMHANSNGYYVSNCGATSTCDEHNFIIEEVTSLPVTISAAGYASWFAPVAVQLPAEVNAYYLKQDGVHSDYVSMAEIGFGGIVPANTGVILGGPAGNYELAIAETDDVIEGNLLTGTVAAEYIDYDAYVLSKPNGKEIGFYLADRNIDATGNKIEDPDLKNQEGTRFKNNSHKAYLRRTAVSPAMQNSVGFRFRFSGGATTAVEKVESRNENEGIYDLTGRKLEGISGTGIYIVNGKKVLVK